MVGEAQDTYWPIPKFYFIVTIGEAYDISFHEVSGLDVESQIIEFRASNSPVTSENRIPGLIKSSIFA